MKLLNKKTTRFLSFVLALVMVISMLPATAFAAETDDNGTYIIKTADDLVEFANLVNGGQNAINAKLAADIDMTGVAWTPIGGTGKAYAGVFDGNGHKIKNLTISVQYQSATGFFATVNGTVKNLALVDVNVSAPSAMNVGAIVGALSGGTISNCLVSGTVKGKSQVGGLVGRSQGWPTIKDCYNLATVSASGYEAGGIVGYMSDGNVSNVFNMGTVTSPSKCGGITGGCSYDSVQGYWLDTSAYWGVYNKYPAKVQKKTAAEFASAEMVALLNGNREGVWVLDEVNGRPELAIFVHTCADTDFNHICDNGCDVYQGKHADSAEDNDHICDYGCGAQMNECTAGAAVREKETDSSCTTAGTYEEVEYCSVCGAEMTRVAHTKDLASHNYAEGKCTVCGDVDPEHTCAGGTATCQEQAKCAICEQFYGELASCNYVEGKCTVCENFDPAHTCTDVTTDADHKCDVCGAENVTGHDYEVTESPRGADCQTVGEDTYTCNCGDFYTEENSKYGDHNYINRDCTRCDATYDGPSMGLNYALSSDRTYYIVAGIGECTDLDIIIPDTYNGLPVKEIGYRAFYNGHLASVFIPASVTKIGEDAFTQNGGLGAVTFAENSQLKIIDACAFYDCHSLEGIIIPASVTSIGASAFQGCNGFKGDDSVTFAENSQLTHIGDWAFNGCVYLRSIEIPASVVSIGQGCFDYCRSLQGIWVDSDNPYYCSDNRGVLFNKEKTVLNQAPGNINGSYEIPASVTVIDDYAFVACSELKSLTFAEDSQLSRIGYRAFFDCTKLNSFALPTNNQSISIGEQAFMYCKRLKTVNFSASVTNIGSYAFADAQLLPTVSTVFTFAGDAPTFGKYVFRGVIATAYYPVNNATWTTEVMQNYDGTITWVPYGVDTILDSEAELLAALANGGEVVLGGNITITAPIVITNTVELDLNGYTLTYNGDVIGEAMITNKGTLTINDSSDPDTGVINYNYTGANDASYGKGNYTISNAGTLTVNGGKITIANLRQHAKYPIDNNSTTGNAVLVINGGHLYNYNTSAIRQFCNSTVYENSVTINGGLIEGYSAIWVQNPGKQTVNGQLTINGGEIRTTAAAYVNGAPVKDVASHIYFTIDGEGGAWSEGSALSITGGTFNENVYLAEEAPATITIGEGATFNGYVELPAPEVTYVAQIGEQGYETLAAAIAAAQAGDTITFLDDIEENVTINKAISINGAGFQYVGKLTIAGNAGTIDTVTFTNVKFLADTTVGNSVIVDMQRYAEATFTGCDFTSNATAANYYNSYKGITVANDCTIVIKDSTASNLYYLAHVGQGSKSMTVENCTLTNMVYGIGAFKCTNVSVKDFTYNGMAAAVNVKNSAACTLALENVNITTTMNGQAPVAMWKPDSGNGVKYIITLKGENTANGAEMTVENEAAWFARQDASNPYEIVNLNVLEGSGTKDDPYLISSVKDLILFRDSVNAGDTKYNAPGVYVALTADIDMAGATWERGIGDGIYATYDGIFDGKDFAIKNLNLAPVADSDGYFCGGLFGYTYGAAVIKNLVLENITVTANGEGHNVGALVGFANNNGGKLTVSNVTVKNVTIDAPGAYGVGAIVGYSYRAMGTIKGCSVEGAAITGYSFVGGITGYSNSEAVITGCSVKNATITANSKGAGGIAGLALNGTITNNTVSNTSVIAPKNWGYVVGEVTDSGVTVTDNNAAAPQVGGDYQTGKPVVAQIGHKYYTTFAAAYAAAQSGDTITLLKDLSLSEILVIDKAITLDGNGKTLTSTAGRAINVSGANGVTIKNLTIVASGERAINVIQNATNVTIDNVTATAANYTVNVASSAADAKVAIINSELTGLNVVNVAAAGAYVTVEATTLNCADNNANEKYAVLALNKDAKGGSIIATGVTFNINGDSRKATNQTIDGTVTIDGSTEGVEVHVAYISYGNNWYGFATLQAAIDKAQVGDTITLLTTIKITEDTTLDLAGITVKADESCQYDLFDVRNGATLTINGGTFDSTASPDGYGIYIGHHAGTRSGKVVINGGTFIANCTVVYVACGELTINGGNFSIVETDNNDYKYVINCYDTNYMNGSATVTITGGIFDKWNPADNAAEGVNTNFCATGYTANANGDVYTVAKDEVAKIGTVKFSTLAEAVAAAKPGQTITLLKNAAGAGVVIDKNLTIDFGGFTYTLTEGVGSTGTESNGFQILAGNKVLLKKGTLKVADKAADKFYILVQNYADLEVFNMILDGTNLDKWSKTDGDSYTLSNNSGNVSITGTTKIIANNDGELAFAFDVCDKSSWGYTLPTVKVASTAKIEGAVEAVAKVGTVYYATLQQAVDAAATGTTVTLVRDSVGAGVVINKNITINFNGFIYTLTSGVGSTGTESNGFQILKGNKVILQKGTLKVADKAADKFYILVQNYADLEVFNMILDGTNLDKWAFTDGDSYTLSNNSGNVSITGNTRIIANNDGNKAFAFDVCDKTAWGYDLPTVKVASTAKIQGAIEAPVKVGRVYYATFEAGYAAAAASNEVLYLASDLYLTENDVVKTEDGLNVMFIFDENVTFNFDGHTIYVDYDSNELLYAVMYVENGVTVSFVDGNDDKGGIDVKTGDTLAGSYDCVAYMFWKRGTTGNMYIIGGRYHANKLEDSMVYTNGSAKVTVKRGTFILDNVGTGANGSPWIFNAQGRNERHIVVNGGTFNADVFHQYWVFEVQSPETVALQYNEETGLYTVVDAVAYVNEQHFSSRWYTKNVGYATLEEAIAAVKDQQTVTIGKNVYISAPECVTLVKGIAIDKNKTITIANGENVVIDLNEFVISGIADKSGNQELFLVKGNLTVKNGSLNYVASNNQGWNSMITIFDVTAGGVLNLDGVKASVAGSDMNFIVHLNNWGEVTLNVTSCKFTASYVAIRAFNSGYDMNNIVVENTAFHGGRVFWVHNYTAEGKDDTTLNVSIYGNGNTTDNTAPIRFGFSNSVYYDIDGNQL